MTFKEFFKITKGKIILTIVQGILLFCAGIYKSFFMRTGCVQLADGTTQCIPQSINEKISDIILQILNPLIPIISDKIIQPFLLIIFNNTANSATQEIIYIIIKIALFIVLTLIYWYFISSLIIWIYNKLKK